MQKVRYIIEVTCTPDRAEEYLKNSTVEDLKEAVASEVADMDDSVTVVSAWLVDDTTD